MKSLRYTLTLRSDAEPGTGLGTEVVNDLVPRDHLGQPFLPASHMKGLVREALREIVTLRGWDDSWLDRLLGVGGDNARDGTQAAAHFSAAIAQDSATDCVRLVTRTAIENETGTVRAGSLRTSECLAVETAFQGSVVLAASAGEIDELMLRVALCSLPSIGGNRRRGAGRCTICFDDRPDVRPSQLLEQLDAALKRPSAPQDRPSGRARVALDQETVMVHLEFHAHDPVCCPEVPLTATNVLRGGFMIPASAVQGAILDRLNALDADLATQVFEHSGFRAWPLLPACPSEHPQPGFPIWTSLTHRMSKIAAGVLGEDHPTFADPMVEPQTPDEVARAAGLKAADGVLIRRSHGQVQLWRARDMPRHVAAHVSLADGEPQLYTVESLAPMVFRGLVMLPRAAWSVLEHAITQHDHVSFGKSRWTLGGGSLKAGLLSDDARAFLSQPVQTFVVQSPLLIEDDLDTVAGIHAGDVLKHMVESAGFGKVECAEASLGLRFGWNRRGHGARNAGRNRLRAAPVVLPGSVFRLKVPCGGNPIELLGKGIGSGRDRGYGAILPHPGKASSQFLDLPEPVVLKSRDRAGVIAADLVHSSSRSGLSTSQVAWIAGEILKNPQKMAGVIDALKQKSPKSWERWSEVAMELMKLKDAQQRRELDDIALKRVLTGWRDGVRAGQKEENP